MKIQTTNYTYAMGQKRSPIINKENQANSLGLKDQLEMSASSKLLKTCIKKVKDLDVSREERIQQLKQQIQKGEYEVSPQNISEAMWEEGFFFSR